MRVHHSVCVEVGCFSPSLYFETGCFLVLLFLSRGLACVFSNHPPVSVSQLVLSAQLFTRVRDGAQVVRLEWQVLRF